MSRTPASEGSTRPDFARRIAVALEYDFQGAPRVTAKGRGQVAEAIVALAREHGVAVEENHILAEALSQIDLDDEIPEALYRAVANVLTFVLQARGGLGRRPD
jgi:flagellar biosynthesis protein